MPAVIISCVARYPPLLFRIDKSSLGVPRIGVATPWDDCPYTKSNANTFVRAHAYRVFLTSCVGINLGDIPRACGTLGVPPRLIPPHLVELASSIVVILERSECVCENSYQVWSVEGSTKGTSQGAKPRGMSPRLIPTHDTRGGIAHTLEHMSECIINTIQT